MKWLLLCVGVLILASLACAKSLPAETQPTLAVSTPAATVTRGEEATGAVFLAVQGFEPYRVRVISDGLNVRRAPDATAEVYTTLSRGEERTIFAVSVNGWGRITPDDVSPLWMNLDYVEAIK
jgi:uncharacterized protein YgiM (DUF1202 family)